MVFYILKTKRVFKVLSSPEAQKDLILKDILVKEDRRFKHLSC